jgi:bifunctional DNA-binding transcriptional regulator/antitoxin component of YhaV-PrlF toxin-antitoxin module
MGEDLGYSQLRYRNQLTVPANVMKSLALKEGDIVAFYVHDDNVIMAKAQLTIMKPKKS